MRPGRKLFIALALSMSAAGAHAAENGAVIRAGELKARPAIDAPTVAKVAASQQAIIVKRQGGWVQVQSNGQTGWLRTLNVKLIGAGGAAARPKGSGGATALLTGSSGRTATTGVKGMDKDDIRKAVPDPVQLAALNGLAVSQADATNSARQSGLREAKVDHLAKPKGK
jgi:hypothetical protein